MYHSAALHTRALDLLMACLGSDEMCIRFVVTQTAVFTPHTCLLVLPVDFGCCSLTSSLPTLNTIMCVHVCLCECVTVSKSMRAHAY